MTGTPQFKKATWPRPRIFQEWFVLRSWDLLYG